MNSAKEQSLAVIAGDGSGHGVMMWHYGEQIADEVRAMGTNVDDLGFGDAPAGVTVWEGRYVWRPGSYEYPLDGETEAVGEFRAPTDDEWAAIRAGRNPWGPADAASQAFGDAGRAAEDLAAALVRGEERARKTGLL